MNEKVLLVTTVYPYPKDNGKKIILSSILEYYNSIYSNKNVHIALIGNDEKIVNNSVEIFYIPKPNKFLQIFNVFKGIITKSKSIQEAVLYSKNIENELNTIIERENYDYILFDTIRTAQYSLDRYPNNKKIVYMDDLFSIRYKKMLEVLSKYPNIDLNPLGNFKKFLPNSLVSLIKSKFITKTLLKIEKSLVQKSELRVIDEYSNCLLISEDEVQYIKLNFRRNNVEPIKPLLKRNSFKRNIDLDKREFIFLGNLSIAHNDVSITNFIEKNINKLVEHNMIIKVIGKKPSEKLTELAEKNANNIKLIGFVENLEDEFTSSVGMIVPLIFGTGVKIKTLEAFSYGLPVISTSYGIEGINTNVNNNTACYIHENSIELYWKSMLKLCDIDYNNRISRNSYNFFEKNYTKNAIYKEYGNLLLKRK